MSHEDVHFSSLDLNDRRQTMNTVLPPPLYVQPPKIAKGKYVDMHYRTNVGTTPSDFSSRPPNLLQIRATLMCSSPLSL